MLDRDEILDVRIALSTLDKKEKSVIVLYFFEGRTEKEISELFSVSQQRVNILKKRALSKLRKFLN